MNILAFAKKPALAALAVATLAAGFSAAAPGTAEAGWYGKKHYHGYGYGYRPHYRGGAIAAGVVGGLALGAIAASAAPAYYGDCYLSRERVHDGFGNVYVRRVRVCE